MSCKRYELLMFEYLDGLLPEAEKDALEAHLESCPACARELAATRGAMSEVDSHLASGPDLNVEAALASVRQRIEAEHRPAAEQPPSLWSSLRWWLGGGLAAAAAAGIAAVIISGTGPEPVEGPELHPAPDHAEPGSLALEAATMSDLLEQMPLYENLEVFRNYERIAGLVEEDPELLEQILEEVQG